MDHFFPASSYKSNTSQKYGFGCIFMLYLYHKMIFVDVLQMKRKSKQKNKIRKQHKHIDQFFMMYEHEILRLV